MDAVGLSLVHSASLTAKSSILLSLLCNALRSYLQSYQIQRPTEELILTYERETTVSISPVFGSQRLKEKSAKPGW